MTVYQYAIACEAGRLLRESDQRELTERELELLRALMPTLQRIELQEAICPSCGAPQYGNISCRTCRRQLNPEPVRAFMDRLDRAKQMAEGARP